MIIFNEGRKPFLDFLRNLTPQVILASSAILLGVRLDFERWDLSNFGNTIAFYACIAFFGVASYASMTLYMEETFRSLQRYERVARVVGRRDKRVLRALAITARVVWRHDKSVIIEVCIAFIAVYTGFVIVGLAALNAARAALR